MDATTKTTSNNLPVDVTLGSGQLTLTGQSNVRLSAKKYSLSNVTPNDTSNVRTSQYQGKLKPSSVGQWKHCQFCKLSFKLAAEFAIHLREQHCKKEGGSFICKFGTHSVCPSLPVEGVSDRDYEVHVAKEHVGNEGRL